MTIQACGPEEPIDRETLYESVYEKAVNVGVDFGDPPLDGIMVTLPIRTVSEGNAREHFRTVAKRKKEHRTVAHMAVAAALAKRGLAGVDFVPVIVTMTRIGPRTLDSDNTAFALKATRDGIADALGIDDGDRERVRWRYRQRRGGAKVWAVEVLVEQYDLP